MELYATHTCARRDFGRHPQFADEPAELVSDMAPQPQVLQEEYIERSPCVTTVQIAPEMSEHEVNTLAATFQNKGMVHQEGGWPRDIDYTEIEQNVRFRKKIEKDEDYVTSIGKLGAGVEAYIRQNNAVDIYEEYFSGDVVDHSSEQPYAKTMTIFRDPSPIQRSAQYISWYPDGARKVAVAYSIMQFQGQPEGMNTSSYIWDVSNPITPDQELKAPSQLCSINYNPKDPNVLLGGMYNGQMAFWDTRKGASAVDASPIEKSHSDPVYDHAWLQSKTGTECVSVSTDGNVFWWDTRRLGEPVEELVLKGKNDTSISGAVSIEYEAVAGPTKFMVGTEQGTVMSCNRKAKTPADRVGVTYSGHHGLVYSLERNPFYPKYFMSIGDWTARVWMEDLKTPIISTKYHSSYLTGGTWSPTRPGVFFTIRMDGVLDVWDYFYKQKDPVLSVQVSDSGLTSFNLHDQGKLMTTGDAKGNVCLLDLYEGLAVMQANEKQAISQMFERETKREKNLEARQKELKMKARKEANAAKAGAAAGDDGDEVIAGVERDFFQAVAGDSMEETNQLADPGGKQTDGPAL